MGFECNLVLITKDIFVSNGCSNMAQKEKYLMDLYRKDLNDNLYPLLLTKLC